MTESTDSAPTMPTLREMSEARRSRALRRLWHRLSGVYGADRWERAYGAEPAAAWASGLGHCTLDGLSLGIEACERDETGRLPTLGEFRARCRRHQPGTYSGAAAPEPDSDRQALPSPAQVLAAGSTARAWRALLQLDGVLAMGESTVEDLDAALEGRDVEAMRREHDAAFRRLGHGDYSEPRGQRADADDTVPLA